MKVSDFSKIFKSKQNLFGNKPKKEVNSTDIWSCLIQHF